MCRDRHVKIPYEDLDRSVFSVIKKHMQLSIEKISLIQKLNASDSANIQYKVLNRQLDKLRNERYTIGENKVALGIEDDPAMARFHGDVSKYSDYVKKTDFGSAEANQKAAKKAQNIDKTQAVADFVSLGCGMATTFGSKTIEVVDDVGNVSKYTRFDRSPSNIKTNVLKTFGFKVDKTSVVVDEAGVAKTTISNLDDIGRFSELILDFESVHQWVTPYDMRDFAYYLGYWATREANDIRHQDLGAQDAVQISTIHQAKGLEWPVVFIPTLTNRRFPSQRRNRGTEHLMESDECTGRVSVRNNSPEAQERFDEELRLWYVALTRSKKYLFISGIECTRTHTSQFASNIQHDYVCTDPQTVFSRPNRIDPSVPIDATILPTNFSDLRYYWDCPKDYLLRRLMGFSPGVNESYGYGQQIHNLLALLHETLPNSNVDDAWIESQVDGHFNLRYTRGEPLEAMKAAAKRILKNYLHDDPELRSKVLHAEKPFEFIIGDAMISGTIDLLNKADPAGENEAKVEIVDFKTGKSGDDLAAAERRSHVQQQLQMYAIATQDALGLEPLKATAHFLYANQPHIKEDVELSEEQMENMKHQIANTVTAIKQGRFPLCASKTRCTSCDFKAICNGSTR